MRDAETTSAWVGDLIAIIFLSEDFAANLANNGMRQVPQIFSSNKDCNSVDFF